jgi:hypothetical protein
MTGFGSQRAGLESYDEDTSCYCIPDRGYVLNPKTVVINWLLGGVGTPPTSTNPAIYWHSREYHRVVNPGGVSSDRMVVPDLNTASLLLRQSSGNLVRTMHVQTLSGTFLAMQYDSAPSSSSGPIVRCSTFQGCKHS